MYFKEALPQLIQRTLFNKLTLDRIEEVFAPHFTGAIEPQIQVWREAVEAGEVAGRQFYISVNDKWEIDGILMVDDHTQAGVIYARTKEITQSLLERARRGGSLIRLSGDQASCQWVQEMNLLAP